MNPGWLPALIVFAILAGCAGAKSGEKSPATRGFNLASIAKSDVDMIAEIHQDQAIASLRVLTEKLYKRNPREWKKGDNISIEAAMARIFDEIPHWAQSELSRGNGIDRIHYAFNPLYEGDRVFMVMAGLTSMVIASYNHKTEFYLTDELDPQKLYNSARNVEVAAWKLATGRDEQGQLLLLSNSMDGEAPNLSFEREVGKLVATQDNIALVLADRSQRSLVRAVQGVGAMFFLPI